MRACTRARSNAHCATTLYSPASQVIPFLFAAAGPEALLGVSVAMICFQFFVDFAHRFDAFRFVGTSI